MGDNEKPLMGACALLSILLLIFIILYGTKTADCDANHIDDGMPHKLYAHCQMMMSNHTDQMKAMGTVKFEQARGGDLKIMAAITNIPHHNITVKNGLHVHKLGVLTTCGTTDGHYNPEPGVEHGAPEDDFDKRHVGDFGNWNRNNDTGSITQTKTDKKASLYGKHSIIGHAMVLHQGQDDLGKGTGSKKIEEGSKANGNAGARVGCCVIGFSEAPKPK